jgi:DNA ligase 1
MTIKSIFDEISSEPSTNLKMEILTKYKDNELLKRVLYLANSKRVKFHIKQIPSYEPLEMELALPLEIALNTLMEIAERKVTGNEAILVLTNILNACNPDDSYIIERIIEKDCRIGMGTTFINKVFPDLIEKVSYLGCKPYNRKHIDSILKANPVNFSQLKLDGRYTNVLIRNHEVELMSRQGELSYLEGALFLEELKLFDDCVFNGELTMDNYDGTTMDRYTSNGIIASLISIGKKKAEGENVDKDIRKLEEKHMSYFDALSLIRLTIWDTITVDEYFNGISKVPYYQRFENLKNILSKHNTVRVSIVECREVRSYEEVIAHFMEALNNKQEGTILKAYDGIWKDGKPTTQIKLKKEIELDLRIVAYKFGTGKNANVISSLVCQSEDGKLVTSPTGMNEDMMQHITENQDKYRNTITAMKCSGLSQDHLGNYSVLHPRFEKLRDDKSVANTLEECIEINESSQFL